ncbi:hypothetical protein D9619_004097 [Psilocybe cf. subviscida]|uniref:FAD/NAD(P)-binding domain-containing protein n=1 Tax=Psilocybe cf. subviscida TaxID=2480587 RepID=A0A8H5BPF0_9AGAR|nr:hypothetical protein D9619_004097 [Psilocybe cf. subviscida]
MAPPPSHGVVIIGAGFGGIAAAIELRKQGINDFVIIEKASGVGGTWKDNTYPGASSDIAIHLYCLSTDYKYDWENGLESQANILKYMESIVEKRKLGPNMIFNEQVIEAVWDNAAQTYRITTRNTQTDMVTNRHAKNIVSAHGILHVPRYPDIPGLDTFKGKLMHSSGWDQSVDLRNKRVAIIGNGSSGAQIMSRIPKLEGIQVTQFVRGRNWHLPTPFRYIKVSLFNWIFNIFPLLAWVYRFFQFCFFEVTYYPIFKSTTLRPYLIKIAAAYTRWFAPAKYHDMLIPSFAVGCKRIVYDPGYLELLDMPNITLREGTEIDSLNEKGIVLKSGEALEFDVIGLATGFIADQFPYTLRGSAGTTVQEFYSNNGGPQAYIGTTIPGFPNFYTIGGPNTATGFTSVLIFEEIQVKYITKMIKPVLEQKVSSFEVKKDAHDSYNKKIEGMFQDTAFTSCVSWYRAGGTGRIVNIFPGTIALFFNVYVLTGF